MSGENLMTNSTAYAQAVAHILAQEDVVEFSGTGTWVVTHDEVASPRCPSCADKLDQDDIDRTTPHTSFDEGCVCARCETLPGSDIAICMFTTALTNDGKPRWLSISEDALTRADTARAWTTIMASSEWLLVPASFRSRVEASYFQVLLDRYYEEEGCTHIPTVAF